ncbi:acyl-CoA synthetase (AMP-forming)/AMP-acid ligase II [Mumia flava]|uniref:Acyl-CoA synthetase (AMP-forming)/AMP-acid ligase II n=1 Tax=Mumia flava TaxID=1348852 RepID=A0A0B2BTL2_9ACTN|nr:long-chain-fatty-acid--CoA ligase [Mumia flava]PJJ57244.1 acyl-CoA synthetase (AMP-forming)/AMP-acid ligase II [Mumia flava]
MTQPPDPTFLDDRLSWWAEVTPDAEAMTYGERTWTFAQMHERVRRAAGGLRDLGLGHGDTVAFLDKNHPACLEVTLAAASRGMATAIVNWRLAGDELDYTINDSGARVLFVGTELVPAIELIRDRLPAVEKIITVTPDGEDGDEYEAWLAASEGVGHAPDLTPDDTCLVMYSSGTTGRPKGVMLSHRAMVAHTVNSHEGWAMDPGDKALVAMPLFHVGGTSYAQFGLYDGFAQIMTREPDPVSLATAIAKGANSAFLVPAVAQAALNGGPQAVALFSKLKMFSYGAAPMPLPLLQRAMEAWPDTQFMQVYGLTEVCGVITHLLPEAHTDADHPERLLSAGTVLPEAEVRVVDPATLEDVPDGEAGELWFRTPQLMKGFLNKPEETAKVITPDGWFRTGDIGRVVDGYVYVEDRIKDMIVTGGENVYSPEVERVLTAHPAIAEVAVIGVPDERWGETVKAVVAFQEGADGTAEEVIAYAREHLAHFKCPTSVDVVEMLPRNPSGKILKRELRKGYWAESGRQV